MTLNTPYYDPRVVIYERKCFIRLATGFSFKRLLTRFRVIKLPKDESVSELLARQQERANHQGRSNKNGTGNVR